VLTGKSYLTCLGKQQDIETVLVDIEREFGDLCDVFVVSVCMKHYII
jgi:hypothetical protein